MGLDYTKRYPLQIPFEVLKEETKCQKSRDALKVAIETFCTIADLRPKFKSKVKPASTKDTLAPSAIDINKPVPRGDQLAYRELLGGIVTAVNTNSAEVEEKVAAERSKSQNLASTVLEKPKLSEVDKMMRKDKLPPISQKNKDKGLQGKQIPRSPKAASIFPVKETITQVDNIMSRSVRPKKKTVSFEPSLVESGKVVLEDRPHLSTPQPKKSSMKDIDVPVGRPNDKNHLARLTFADKEKHFLPDDRSSGPQNHTPLHNFQAETHLFNNTNNTLLSKELNTSKILKEQHNSNDRQEMLYDSFHPNLLNSKLAEEKPLLPRINIDEDEIKITEMAEGDRSSGHGKEKLEPDDVEEEDDQSNNKADHIMFDQEDVGEGDQRMPTIKTSAGVKPAPIPEDKDEPVVSEQDEEEDKVSETNFSANHEKLNHVELPNEELQISSKTPLQDDQGRVMILTSNASDSFR